MSEVVPHKQNSLEQACPQGKDLESNASDWKPDLIKANVRFMAEALGFPLFGVCSAERAEHADDFINWLDAGYAADMSTWMERSVEKRCEPSLVLEGARSMIVLGMPYGHPPATSEKLRRQGALDAERSGTVGKTAHYAEGWDYHKIIEEKLADLNEEMQAFGGAQRCYVDTGPVLERDAAVRAGLGWCGKSGMLIHPQWGSRFFIAVIVTTLPLPFDKPMSSRCGLCSRCLEACPTGAIIADRCVDARRCLSYLTIEHKGEIPDEYARLMGKRVYGCDACVDACPWNRKPPWTTDQRFSLYQSELGKPLASFLSMDEETFIQTFKHSPLRRLKLRYFLRNVCRVLEHVGGSEDVKSLELYLKRHEGDERDEDREDKAGEGANDSQKDDFLVRHVRRALMAIRARELNAR